MTTLEFAWRVTQQIITFRPDDTLYSNINGWGSGFFYRYNHHIFLVTADHVIHYDDYESGEGRISEDDKIAVVNNRNAEGDLKTVFTPIGGLYFFDSYDLSPIMKEDVTQDDIELASIPELIDSAFAVVSEVKEEIYTHELRIKDKIWVKNGLLKTFIDCNSICKASVDGSYIVAGTVRNQIKNGIVIDRCNAVYDGLKYDRTLKDGNIILTYHDILKRENWAGLSGGPVLSSDGHLLGVILDVQDGGYEITVKPMEQIHRLMDYALMFEFTQG